VSKFTAADAVDLLSQQVWCWGCDIARKEGNWLVEIGFQRTPPPEDRSSESSVYSISLPSDRNIVLRGFGVFYGASDIGGIFLPRYQFRPLYTTKSELQRPPWSDTDLPRLNTPNNSQKSKCISLLHGLIDWICCYEEEVTNRLGIEYRQSTLKEWNNGKRRLIPAGEIVSRWRELSQQVTRDSSFCFEEANDLDQ
jgi:hypothetical protein